MFHPQVHSTPDSGAEIDRLKSWSRLKARPFDGNRSMSTWRFPLFKRKLWRKIRFFRAGLPSTKKKLQLYISRNKNPFKTKEHVFVCRHQISSTKVKLNLNLPHFAKKQWYLSKTKGLLNAKSVYLQKTSKFASTNIHIHQTPRGQKKRKNNDLNPKHHLDVPGS